MKPMAMALPAPHLSGEDVAIGEILMSLKTCAVVHASASSPVEAVLQPGTVARPGNANASAKPGFRKLDLKVTMPSTTTFDHSTESPVASALYAVPPTAHSPSERSKRYGPVIQLEDLRKCFNMPIASVARQFGICATLLKKICRRHGIQRWPHRQIRSLQKSIDMLRESLTVAKGSNKEYIAKKITAFEYTLECIMKDPNTAAKGISSGRLASPASDELAKRAKRSTKLLKPLASNAALAAAMSDDDDQDQEMNEVEAENDVDAATDRSWSPTDADERSMSLKSILC